MPRNPLDTPLMRQYYDIKKKHPDAILLFRVGDFYEMYGDDAIAGAEILGIAQTKRSNGKTAAEVPMAGFPHHALDSYLPRLVRAGKRVAICDQLEDPKLAKTLVKRGLTELVTPGVSMGDALLNNKENNWLAAVHFEKDQCGIAFLDISTGEFLTAEGVPDYMDKLLNNFSPKEVLVERAKRRLFEERFGSRYLSFELEDWAFNYDGAVERLLKHFEVKNLKGFGVENLRLGLVASGAVLHYLDLTQHTHISHITKLSRIEEARYVRLDKFTVRSLELVSPMNEGGSSLLGVMDKTISPMGSRLLRRWLLFPLKDIKPIEARQHIVEYFFKAPELRETLEEAIGQIGDLERIISKVAVGRVTPRELVQLKNALNAIVPIKAACLAAEEPDLQSIGGQLDACDPIRERIAKEITPDPPLLVNKGGVIAKGVNAELDELRELSFSGKDYLLKIQQREIERTGISSL
ncbi:MAG: DNA mismatch repair protein MutS, partial [Tannerella sp.]|nr:DNA mismatch repair protein MutS [Tannerella sp.]